MTNTSYSDASRLIRQRVGDNKGLISPDNDIQYENMKTSPDPRFPYVMVNVLFDENQQKSIGADQQNLQRLTGLIFFNIVVPSNQGTLELRNVEDNIAEIFKNVQFDCILTFGIALGMEVVDASGDWYKKRLSIPFQYDYN